MTISLRVGSPGENAQARRGYNPAHFDTLMRALSATDIPNRKTDVNINPRPLAFPFPEENEGYTRATMRPRRRICLRHRDLSLGLLWFLQNDAQGPVAHREIARGYHLPLDEFTDNEHFPFQLYVREGRRLVGEYTLTEHDMTTGRRRHADAIAVGEFPIAASRAASASRATRHVLEGYLGMLDRLTRPYEIPYRIMIPRGRRERDRSGRRFHHARGLFIDPPGAHLDGARPSSRRGGAPRAASRLNPAPRPDGPAPTHPGRSGTGR